MLMILNIFAGAMALAPSIVASPAGANAANIPDVVATAETVHVPALTPLRLRVVGEVSSKTHAKGDKVRIVLADALYLTDTLAIPAGTVGVAEVIHSAKGGMGGKAGELLIAARHLEFAPGLHIPLRSFRLQPADAKNNQGLAMGLTIAGGVAGGIAAMVITGGSARIADGSEAFAKTAAAVELPIARLRPSAPVAPVEASAGSAP